MNALTLLVPYKFDGQWVFDDANVGLLREPFVFGADAMIDALVGGIPDADRGFHLLFSAAPFPGHTIQLEWRREEYEGNWYWCAQLGIEGWLCPALLKYFDVPPREIYAQVRPRPR